MREYIELGSTPIEENCTQTTDVDFESRSAKECKAYAHQLKRLFPNSSFSIKSFAHDFGNYKEVVVYYNPDNQEDSDRAANIENNLPLYWDDKARAELTKEEI